MLNATPDGFERLLQLRLGVIPGADLTQELRWPGRQLHLGDQAEVAVDALNQAQQPLDLRADLLLPHEAVRVVL